MGAMGVGATTIAITSIAFAVTGVNKAIDKAAANVFGEDLVKVANLAGMAYGMFGGGFNIGEGASAAGSAVDTAATAGDYVNQMDMASDAFTAASSTPAIASSVPQVDTFRNGMDVASDLASAPTVTPLPPVKPEPFNLAQKATETTSKVVSPQATNDIPVTTAASTQRAQTPDFQATNSATTAVTSATKPAASAAAPSTSFMDRLTNLATSPQVLTGVVQGVAGAYSSSQAREAQQAELDKRDRLSKVGGAGWKQTFRTA